MAEEKRIDKALDAGEQAFWAAVASQFPEIKTGDFAPDAAFTLRNAMKIAIREWLDANAPGDSE